MGLALMIARSAAIISVAQGLFCLDSCGGLRLL